MATYGYYQQPGHVITAGVLLSLLALLAVSLRLWTRYKCGQGFRADDWLIVPAALLTVGQGINLVVGVANKSLATTVVRPTGYDANPLAIHTPQTEAMGKVSAVSLPGNTTSNRFWVCQAEFYYISTLPLILGLVKLSFLLFYVRIFVVHRTGAIGIMLYTLIVIVSLWTVAFFFAVIFECRLNFWAAWGSTVDVIDNCFNTLSYIYGLCLSDFITDVVVILIPIPLVWRLKISRRRKIAIAGIFLLGAVSIAASLTRLIMMIQIVYGGFDPSDDSIMVVTKYMYWGMVECGTGVTAACLSSLQVLARISSIDSAWHSLVSVFTSRHRNRSVDSVSHHNGSDGVSYPSPNPKASRNGYKHTSDDALPMRDWTAGRETV
ncbi:hypothetical protein CP532_0705 [Ophiocordyceps camponoti-leonardi (nom. inval.)]|nr:hypothetical protein CP532_0705 [Ophiocordyceps camponoti-leonardi (nom. inval.)]